MRWSIFHLSLALAAIGVLPTLSASAAVPSPGNKTAIVLVLDGATWQELRSPQLPNMSRFLQTAAVGLMNTKGPQDRDPASVWVTLGAGRGAEAQVKQARVDSPNMGAPAEITNFADIVRANERGFTQAKPGLLGETLASSAIERTLIRIGTSSDMSPVLVADMAGNVPRLLDVSPGEVMRIVSEARGFIVISLALPQPAYQESYPSYFDPDEGRMNTLTQADALLGEIWDSAGGDTLVGLISPSCPRFVNQYVRAFAPIAIRGAGFSSGLLESSSTHRTGLVANSDFAPTVLTFFSIGGSVEMTGRPLYAQASPTPLETLDALDRQTAVAHRLREEFTRLFIAIAGAVLFLLVVLLFAVPKAAGRAANLLAAVILLLTASPLAVFLLSATSLDSAVVYLMAVLLVAGMIAAVASRMGRFPNAFGIICLATAAAVWADLLAGSPIMRRSLLGFDPIISGRFYGLGNHEAGLLISATILSAGILLDSAGAITRRSPRAAITFLLILMVFSIGSSLAGANWGQGLSAALTALALWLLLSPIFLRRKSLPVAAALFVLAALILIATELALPSARQSHLGDSLRLTLTEGSAVIPAIIKRKLIMAVRFSTYSPFLALAVPVFAGLIVLPLRPPRRLREVVDRYPSFAAALAACGMGGVAASLLNDSGIVAGIAITCLPMIGLIHLSLEATRENPGH
ncbi:MAG: hypothetical protein GTO55_06510 [Armatimonadetes bacterium]|nr:hypothetical protein [Armatimonadota bacterium]NIM23935.1 hypothetical protein [Armatimonadota bacterium]NIM67782.1 hypothetical protein [Armatimonadota bacterium]NIM76322.1 hypothetical protein [Armatimonadota bacterium]NIN06016.1 hypothetical protein [Armatimonadota bacterium]